MELQIETFKTEPAMARRKAELTGAGDVPCYAGKSPADKVLQVSVTKEDNSVAVTAVAIDEPFMIQLAPA